MEALKPFVTRAGSDWIRDKLVKNKFNFLVRELNGKIFTMSEARSEGLGGSYQIEILNGNITVDINSQQKEKI